MDDINSFVGLIGKTTTITTNTSSTTLGPVPIYMIETRVQRSFPRRTFTKRATGQHSSHDFVSKFDPKPNAVIFNQSLWNHDVFLDPLVQKKGVKAISDAGMVSIYKTTTKIKSVGKKGALNEAYERDICAIADYCLDLSWTWLVPDYLYADGAHFYEPVYTWFNIKLLSLLSSFLTL
jgi:hypothetical protein